MNGGRDSKHGASMHVAVFGALLGFCAVASGGLADLLGVLPVILLATFLAFDRYPGEKLIARIAQRTHRATPRACSPAPLWLCDGVGIRERLLLLAASRPLRGPPLLSPALPSNAIRRVRGEIELTKGKKSMRRIAIATMAACALLAPAVAQAHVSLHPNEVPTGSFATLDIRVPNETDNANTIKLAVQVPPGFLDISTEYMPGWTAKVLTAKLAKPVHTSDGTVTEQVREVVWTGDGKQGKIPPGQFLNFPISTVIPGKEGQELTFKALQFYDNGKVVRWIGSPSSDSPAPKIDVTAPGGVLQDVAGSETAPPSPSASSEGGGTTSSSSSDSASKGLGIAALIVGALGLLAGGAALLRSRPRTQGGKAA